MKRKEPLGYVQDEKGNRYPVTHQATAEALRELQALNEVRKERIKKQEHALASLSETVTQRNLQLAKLQNHWWVRLGEAVKLLRFVEK